MWPLILFLAVLAIGMYALSNAARASVQRLHVAWEQVKDQAERIAVFLEGRDGHSLHAPTHDAVERVMELGKQARETPPPEDDENAIEAMLDRLHFTVAYYNDIAGFFNQRFRRFPWVCFGLAKTYRPRPLFPENQECVAEAE